MIVRHLCSRIEEVEKKLCCSRKNITLYKLNKDYLVFLESCGEYYLLSTWEKVDEPEKYIENIKKSYKLK